MKRVFYILASWTMLFYACSGLTSCDKEEDDPKTENNSNGGDQSGNESDVSGFTFTKSYIQSLTSRCKSGAVLSDGKKYVFAYYNDALNVFEFQSATLSSITACKGYADKSKAQVAYNDAIAPQSAYATVKLIDTYVASTSVDPDVLSSFKGLSITQLEAYLPIYIKSMDKEDEEDEDITSPLLSPADASLLCRNAGDYVLNGKNSIYINQNGTLKSCQFKHDKIVSVSTYKDYKTNDFAKAAYDDALLTSRDLGEWSVVGTFLVVTSTDPDVLKPYQNMTLEELEESLNK